VKCRRESNGPPSHFHVGGRFRKGEGATIRPFKAEDGKRRERILKKGRVGKGGIKS